MRRKASVVALVSVIAGMMWVFPVVGQEKEKNELKPALVVMDVQNIWMPMMAEEDRQTLRTDGHNTVFLCGLSATGCVLATYFGAIDREFSVIMVNGALLSHNTSYTRVIEDICHLMTIEEIREELNNASQNRGR